MTRDLVREALLKGANDRTEEDIEVILEFFQHFPVRFQLRRFLFIFVKIKRHLLI